MKKQREHLFLYKCYSEQLFEFTRSLSCHQKATAFLLFFQTCFSSLFAYESLLYYRIPTCSGEKTHLIPKKNASQDSELLFELTYSLCCHHNGNGNRVDFHEMLFITRTCEIADLLESTMFRCEDNTVSISFSKNASESCCFSLLDQFVVIKRQRQSSRYAFRHYSHMRVCCSIGIHHTPV